MFGYISNMFTRLLIACITGTFGEAIASNFKCI